MVFKYDTKAQRTKEKIDKPDTIEMKNFRAARSKHALLRSRKNMKPTEWKKIVVSYI